jgi:hypothetical protein
MPTVLVAFLNVHNNVALGSINFLCTQNTFFIFLAPNMVYFVKQLPKICFKNGPTQFYKILYHILCTIHQLFASKKFSRLPSTNRQICANSAGSGSNLYYKYFIVFSYFFCILFSYFKDLKLNQEKETKKKTGRPGQPTHACTCTVGSSWRARLPSCSPFNLAAQVFLTTAVQAQLTKILCLKVCYVG